LLVTPDGPTDSTAAILESHNDTHLQVLTKNSTMGVPSALIQGSHTFAENIWRAF